MSHIDIGEPTHLSYHYRAVYSHYKNPGTRLWICIRNDDGEIRSFLKKEDAVSSIAKLGNEVVTAMVVQFEDLLMKPKIVCEFKDGKWL
jgi:hypothetical protein